MDVILKENERIDDLERNGYRIIQNKARFCFGMDAVLLSGFACEGELGRAWKNADAKRKKQAEETDKKLISQKMKIVDLGTGTGIIPILLHAKLGFGKIEHEDGQFPLTALEIQPEVKDMACRSVKLNNLDRDINIVEGDIKEASSLLGKACFDVVTSNPPYMKHSGGLTNPDESKAISRHEILCTFEDVAREAAALLKSGGRFYLVHRPERLADLIDILKKYKMEPKRIRLVHSFADSEATMVLLESVRGGKAFMKVEKPLIIYKDKGVYTDEIMQIYGF